MPFSGKSFDAVLSHAVFEHLARPLAALAELRRVLRPGGVLGVCSSDWGDAQIEPRGEDVDLALRCHLLLRRKAGGDPYAGARLPGWIEAAGFTSSRSRASIASTCEDGHLSQPWTSVLARNP